MTAIAAPLPPSAQQGLRDELASARLAHLALLRQSGQHALARTLERACHAAPHDLETVVDRLAVPVEALIDAYIANAIVDLDDYEDQLQAICTALDDLAAWRARASGQTEIAGL